MNRTATARLVIATVSVSSKQMTSGGIRCSASRARTKARKVSSPIEAPERLIE
jgi:hypothetical protein